MAYWQVRAKLDNVSYIDEFVKEDKWELLSQEHKASGVFRDSINSIQEGEILFLADGDTITHYARCKRNLIDGIKIEVDGWKGLTNPIPSLNKGNAIKTITPIKNNEKIYELLGVIEGLEAHKIQKIKITNFRLIEKLEIDFNEDINVIIGDNGSGKTTILDAIALGFGTMLTHFPSVKGIGFSEKDLRINDNNKKEPFTRIEIRSTDNLLWDKIDKRDKAKTTTKTIPDGYGTKELESFVDRLITCENEDKKYVMPLIIYYGTCRNCFDTPMRRVNFQKEFSRFDSLTSSLKGASNFSRLFEWFDAMENLERRERDERWEKSYRLGVLEEVRKAIESMLPHFKNPRIKIKPLRFMVDKVDGNSGVRELQIEQLSAGYKAVLAMVMDISARMAQANPHLGNDSKAVILIDEIDLHLHPKWQQTILSDLRRTFPNAQFIVTTHSPHIVSSITKDKLLRIEDGIVKESYQYTYGKQIDELLLGTFDLKSLRYPDVDRDITFLQQSLYSPKYDENEFVEKLEILENKIGKDDIDILRLKLEKLKREKNEKNK